MKLKKIKYKSMLLILVCMAGAIVGSYFLFLGKKRVPSSSFIHTKVLRFVPSNIGVSDDAKIRIVAAKGCFLKINTSWGTQVISLEKELLLPKSLTSEAGIHHLSVWCGYKNLESKTLEISPSETEGEIDSYIGSKSIPADNGMHWSMFTALPTDRFRNMVADATPVKIKMIRPNGEQITNTKSTKNGVAYVKILSNSQIGKTIISSGSDDAFGKEKELLELPNFPVSVNLKTEKYVLYADNRQFFKILTNELKDKYGNRVADGTLVKFKVTDSKGNLSHYRTFSSDGIASLNIQNPDIPGLLSIVAYIDNLLVSTPYQLDFEPYITRVEADQVKEFLKIGPILGPLGQLVSDGKEIAIVFKRSRRELSAILKNGHTVVEIPKGTPKGEEVLISIGGVQTKLIIK
jgi:hypothetical protein